MSNSRNKPPASAGGNNHIAQLDECDPPKVGDVGSSSIVGGRVDGRKARLRCSSEDLSATAGFQDIWVTPSLVTERACKACAYAHARFDSAVTHHPSAGFANSRQYSRTWYIGSAMRCPRIDSGSIPLVRAKLRSCILRNSTSRKLIQ